MADNVIVRVPEQQFIKGEDGYSPEVTIEDITHGHRVTITDAEHPVEGRSFDVLDGDSAYEQAVAGGYTGTEEQFNAELAAFKDLSDETKEAAPFYAEYGVTTKAEIAAAINGKRQIYAYQSLSPYPPILPYVGKIYYVDEYSSGTGYRFALTEGRYLKIFELTSSWNYRSVDLEAPAQRAEEAADQALIRMNSAATSAQDAEAYAIGKRKGIDVGAGDPASNNNSKYYAEQASGSASDAATAKGAAETAQGKAEDAQEAAEQAQEAAEAVLASIPEDYTALSGDVDNLKSATEYLENAFDATTVSGAIATFELNEAGAPIKQLIVNIDPVQAEGTPTPETPIPISGWTGCKLFYPGLDITRELSIVESKYINASGVEATSTTSDLSHTEYFPVTPGETLFISFFLDEIPNAAPSIAFYDGDKTFQGRQNFLFPPNSNKGYVGYNLAIMTVPAGRYFAILNFKLSLRDRMLLTNEDPTITFPSPDPGTVYGGKLDVVNKKLTVDKIAYIATGTGPSAAGGMRFYKSSNTSRNEFYTLNSNNGIVVPSQTSTDKAICSHFRTAAPSNSAISCFVGSSQFRVAFPLGGDIETTAQMNAWVAEQYNNGTPLTYVLTLAAPIVYNLGNLPEIKTFTGKNSIWVDCGDISVTYGIGLKGLNDVLAAIVTCFRHTAWADPDGSAYVDVLEDLIAQHGYDNL